MRIGRVAGLGRPDAAIASVARVGARDHDAGARRSSKFRLGDWVMRRRHVLSSAAQHFPAKLTRHYDGPYKIDQRRSAVVYELVDEGGVRVGKVHVKDLKTYFHSRNEQASDGMVTVKEAHLCNGSRKGTADRGGSAEDRGGAAGKAAEEPWKKGVRRKERGANW